jgi:hypothetical protein
MGKSSALSSCRHTTSGDSRSSHSNNCPNRDRTPLILKVAIFSVDVGRLGSAVGSAPKGAPLASEATLPPFLLEREVGEVVFGEAPGLIADAVDFERLAGDSALLAALAVADLGLPAADLGLPAADLGLPAADLGLPAADLGLPAADFALVLARFVLFAAVVGFVARRLRELSFLAAAILARGSAVSVKNASTIPRWRERPGS